MLRKGIILAGGSGTRLWPASLSTSKVLLPVYSKPMVYYPLSTVMLAGVREVLFVTSPDDNALFRRLLNDGLQWGMRFSYAIQSQPRGIAEAFATGKDFIANSPCMVILGDNIFYGHHLSNWLQKASDRAAGAMLFAHKVKNPTHYGIVEFGKKGDILSLEEKPEKPKSHYAVTGLYMYDEQASNLAAELQPSARGEREITDLNRLYWQMGKLSLQILERGYAWFDAGTHDSLLEAANFVASIERQQGLKISCPEEIAWRKGWISDADMEELGQKMHGNNYGQYLLNLLESD